MKWRRYVKQIAPYVPGKSIELVRKEYNLGKVTRLASNENQVGTSPKAMEAMKQVIVESNLYPDASATKLREKLAGYYEISPNEVMTGNGADDIISMLISAYVNEGDEVLYCIPTFPAYRSTTLLMGGKPVEVPLNDDWCYDLDGLNENITDRTKLIFICNPNNPTSTVVNKEALEDFIKNTPDYATVILDEAYIEYVRKDYVTGLDLFKNNCKVIVIRTFSKFYGLAGLRVGYAIGDEIALQPMLRIREPFANNRLAIEAAVAVLDDYDYTERHLTMNEEGKEYLTMELERIGFNVVPSFTNFLFVNTHRDGNYLFRSLMKHGIIIRPCTAWGYDNHVRISIGNKEQNALLISTLKQIL